MSMSQEAPKEELRQVHVEGKQEGHDLVVGACITRAAVGPNGEEITEYLLVRRDLPHGQWYFPGGKVRKGESMKEALKRELKEELGLEYGTDYEGPFQELSSGAYNIKDKNLAIVNVVLPHDSLKSQPQLQGTDAVKGMIWTADPLSYDLTTQAKEVLAARSNSQSVGRAKMQNIKTNQE